MQLATLLHPLSVEDFAARTFEHRAWLTTLGQAAPIALTDLDQLAAVGLTDRSYSVLAAGAAQRPVAEHVETTPPSTLASALAAGNAIGIRTLEKRWPAAGRMANRLCRDLGHPVTIELWLLPAGFALPAPTARRNLFVLVGEGALHWSDDQVILDRAEGAVREDGRLDTGAMLYLPSDAVARFGVQAGATPSLHLEVHVEASTYRDLVRTALHHLVRATPALRRSVVPGPLDHRWGEIEDDEAAAVRSTLDGLRLHAARIELVQQLSARLAPLPGGHFPTIESAGSLALETRLVVREGAKPYLTQKGGAVTLHFGTAEQRAPAHPPVVQALREMITRKRFVVGDLPDGLSDRSKLVLCKHLLNKGLLGFDPTQDSLPASEATAS